MSGRHVCAGRACVRACVGVYVCVYHREAVWAEKTLTQARTRYRRGHRCTPLISVLYQSYCRCVGLTLLVFRELCIELDCWTGLEHVCVCKPFSRTHSHTLSLDKFKTLGRVMDIYYRK